MSGWTEAEDAVLTAEWKQGLSCSQIARLINARFGSGRSRNAVIGRRMRLGLPKRDTVAQVVRNPRKVKRKPLPNMAEPVLVPVQPAAPPRPEEPMRRVEISELARSECRWPVNDPSEGEVHLFCGRKQADGSSYCAVHLERSISKQSESTRKVQPVSRKVAYS